MEFLSDFNFEIKYTSAKNNQKADILSRREQDVTAQELVKKDSRSRTLLGPSKLDPRINAELAQTYVDIQTISISLLDSEPALVTNSIDLIEELKASNRNSFATLRATLPSGYSLDKDLLFY